MMPSPFRSVLYLSAGRDIDLAPVEAAAPDGVIIDLEDSVPPERKQEARGRALRWLCSAPIAHTTVLRVNDGDDPDRLVQDLTVAANASRLDAVLTPRTEKAGDLAAVSRACRLAPERWIWAMTESGAGIDAIPALAAGSPRLEALVVGYKDLALDLGVPFDPSRVELRSAALRALKLGHQHGLKVFDGVTVGSPDQIAAAAVRARDDGFDGVTFYSLAGLLAARQVLAAT
jgi:citrate lyase beta subunit